MNILHTSHFVILLFLERNPQLEVVVYLDAGSEIDSSPQKLQTFNEYLSLSSEFGYVGFQLPNKEVNWSKADLCELVGSSKDDLQSGQIAGGHLIFNRDFAFEHCSAWLEIMRKDNYHFLDDSFDVLYLNYIYRYYYRYENYFYLVTYIYTYILIYML
jgi:hypothetical protein